MAVTYIRNETTGEFEKVGPGSASTDTTLTQVGKPADAAAVGNALANKSHIGHLHALEDLGVQCGKINVSCTANEVSSAAVVFSRPYETAPIITATAGSSVPGIVSEVTVSNISTTGFTLNVYRTNTSATSIHWIAIGTVS